MKYKPFHKSPDSYTHTLRNYTFGTLKVNVLLHLTIYLVSVFVSLYLHKFVVDLFFSRFLWFISFVSIVDVRTDAISRLQDTPQVIDFFIFV